MRAFSAPQRSVGDLDARTAALLIASASDVAMVLDGEGVIRDIAYGHGEPEQIDLSEWVGKPWAETVTVESREKVEAMLRDAGAGRASRWRHLNHPRPDGSDLPLMCSAVGLGAAPRARAVGRSIVFARDLRATAALQQRLVNAQQSMERDYWRLRHMETRYRSLFQLTSEAVVILDAQTQKVDEANPVAVGLFGEAVLRPGWMLADAFDAAGAAQVHALLGSVRGTGKPDQVRVRRREGGEELDVSVSLFRQENAAHFLVRVLGSGKAASPKAEEDTQALLVRLMEAAPDAFVVTDLEGRILTANHAFLDLTQMPAQGQVLGATLDRWLGRSGVDLSVLINNVRQRGSVRLFATTLRGEYGTTSEVEISAVAVTDAAQPCMGFTIRDVGRRLLSDARASREVPRSVGQMAELVGRMPLKDIVRDTTDLIEQLCIEAALQLTQDNRASAAEMLGLSRQSLYVKLRRFGLGGEGSSS